MAAEIKDENNVSVLKPVFTFFRVRITVSKGERGKNGLVIRYDPDILCSKLFFA